MSQPGNTPYRHDPSGDEYERDDAVIGAALRWSLVVFALIAAVAGGVWWWKQRPPEIVAPVGPIVGPQVREVTQANVPTVKFTNIAAAAGVSFLHVNGAEGEKLLPETMGGGVACFDMDNDGDQDLLLINACPWPWHKPAKPDSPGSATKPHAMLLRNDGHGKFDDVSAGSGLEISCYGMGVAVGDYDNDGLVDVFLAAVGPNHLFRNRGQGKFEEVTATAGVAGDDRWSSSCGFFDMDNDGDLDLFVTNYVKWSRDYDQTQAFSILGIGRAYGPPTTFDGMQNYLYRNDGAGKFTDVSQAAGIHVTHATSKAPVGKGLGVTFVDADRDGWIDILVANDTVQNFFFHNQRHGIFREEAAQVGVAYDSAGKARGAMGIDAARYRDDGSLGVAIGNFANEMSALYVTPANKLLFNDEAIATGFGPPTRLDLKFGTLFFDYDLDGRLDILCANGHLEEEISKVQSNQQYRQAARLFWNAGPKQESEFISVPQEKTGGDLRTPIVGRGAAYADFDGDGDLDVVLTQIAGPPLVLKNEQSLGRHYVRLKLVGKRSNRDAIGSWIELQVAGQTLRRQVMPTRSYLSQVELPVTIGIGDATKIDGVTILWPDGSRQMVSDAKIDTVTVIEQAAAKVSQR